MRDDDERARALTTLQHGLITAAQVHGIGITPRQLQHRLRYGDLEWLTPRVLRLVGTPPEPVHRLLLPVLDAGPGSALAAGAALEHWGVRGFVDERPRIVRRRDHLDHRVRGAVVHEVRFLPWNQVRVLDGVPVVSPALALLQLAGLPSVHTGRLARALDAAWSDRLVSHSTLSAVDRTMSRQGRRGLARFRQLVDERGPGHVPPASNLESRFAQILHDHGRPEMRRQVDTGDDERWIGRVDFRAVDCPLVAEVQSERHHRGLLVEEDDVRRLHALDRAGFVVIEIVEEDLFHAPERVLAQVDDGRQRALLRRAA
jgi:very-short-patch-repair endonuclease